MTYAELRAVRSALARPIMAKYPNVTAVGISQKFRNGNPQGHLALTVYVDEKLPISEVPSSRRIDLDSDIVTRLTSRDYLDVKQLPPVHALSQLVQLEAPLATGRVRPVLGGASEGHFRITAGTGAVLVRDRRDGRVLRVSNNHIYANQNRAVTGDPIYQPAPYDGGLARDRVGTLARFVALNFNPNAPNHVDAAVRTLDAEEAPAFVGLPNVPASIGVAARDQKVVKSGRTTDITEGVITDVDLVIDVGYGGGQRATFESQILVESPAAFSRGGDSGSAVLSADGSQWLGLLFAGSSNGQQTICNHATRVAELLGVDLASPVPAPPAAPPTQPPKTPGVYAKLLVTIYEDGSVKAGPV